MEKGEEEWNHNNNKYFRKFLTDSTSSVNTELITSKIENRLFLSATMPETPLIVPGSPLVLKLFYVNRLNVVPALCEYVKEKVV